MWKQFRCNCRSIRRPALPPQSAKLDRSYPKTDNGLSLLVSDLSVEVDRGPQIVLFSKCTVEVNWLLLHI
jgi:hypothetical protein